MKTSAAVIDYIAHKRALGMRFNSEGAVLKAFCKEAGDIPFATVTASTILVFLQGSGPVTDYWAKKYHVLSGLYKFALARSWVSIVPLPHSIPKPTAPAFVPYIYSHVELKRMLEAVPAACTKHSVIDADVFRALILLLYGAGLRLGEALTFSMADVELAYACLEVRETKFFKHRLVPMGSDLLSVMREYVGKRNETYGDSADAPFLCKRDGSKLTQTAARNAFRRVLVIAQIARDGGPRRQPRFHDLRHTAAMHRLVAWYRTGVDLQERLPRLATYLGHVDLSSTQRYLTMTPQLMTEASLRFERYAMGADHV